MGHRPTGEDPIGAQGTNSPASKQQKTEQHRRRTRKAMHRFQVTKYYKDHLEDLSYREAVSVLEEVAEEGEFPLDDAPSHSTLYRWVKRYEAAQQEGRSPSAFDYLEKPRSGRNRKELDPDLEDWLYDEVLQGTIRSIPRLHEAALKKAGEEGWEAPTEWQVRRYVQEFSVQIRSAAQHGRNAAMVDAMPSSTLPTDRPHDIWLVDEAKAPVAIRTLDPSTKEWVFVKPWVVLVMDVFSRLVLSYHVVDPYRYGADVSYRAHDVLGTLLGAALPELAPEETEEFAGYLPDQIRWDKHSTHQKLAPVLEENGIDVPNSVGEKPHRQGRVERLVGTVKQLSEPIKGAEHAYEPIGDGSTDEHPKSKRRKAAGDKRRLRKRTPIAVEDLHTIEEFRSAFGERVAAYNDSEHSFLDGKTPELAYLHHLDKAASRSGRDAIFLMADKQLTCTKAGFDHQERGHRVRFAAEAGGVEFEVGDSVHCYCDPFQRRLFAEYGGRIVALKPIEEWAEDESAESHARRKNRKASEASEYAEEVQKRTLEEEAGPTAPERAQAALEEETGEDEEDDLPPAREGLVARKRAESRQDLREAAEEGADEEELGEDSRPRRLLANPMDEVRPKEDAS